MVDSSANVTVPVMERIKTFIAYTMDRFNQLDESFMMGVMQFNDRNKAKVIRKVSKYTNEADLERVLRKMVPKRVSKRFTGDALIEASKTVSMEVLKLFCGITCLSIENVLHVLKSLKVQIKNV